MERAKSCRTIGRAPAIMAAASLLNILCRNPFAAVLLANDQIEIALILMAPLLLPMLTGRPPIALSRFCTPKFGQTAQILRWRIVGDLLNTMSWPLAFVSLASGLDRTCPRAEAGAAAVFVFAASVGLPPSDQSLRTPVSLLCIFGYPSAVFLAVCGSIGFAWSIEPLRCRATPQVRWRT